MIKYDNTIFIFYFFMNILKTKVEQKEQNESR